MTRLALTRLALTRRRTATLVAVWITLAAVAGVGSAVARADCTGAGEFGAASGCPPPGGSSDSGDSWPPTSVDWPPGADADESGGSDGASAGGETGGHENAKPPTPIVLPLGQQATPPSEHPTPIVPVD